MSEKTEWMISEAIEALDDNSNAKAVQISQMKGNIYSKDTSLESCWLHSHRFTELLLMTEGEATFLYNFINFVLIIEQKFDTIIFRTFNKLGDCQILKGRRR